MIQKYKLKHVNSVQVNTEMPIIEAPPVPTIQDAIKKAEESMAHAVQGSLATYSTIAYINKILESRSLNSGAESIRINDLLQTRAILIEAEAAARDAQKNLSMALVLLRPVN